VNRSRRGVVLIVVLWVVAILAVVCMALGGTLGFKQAQVDRARDDQAAEQALLSAVALAKSVLVADAAPVDTLADGWTGTDAEAFTLTVGDGVARLHVPGAARQAWGLTDESARLNANTATAAMLAKLPGMTPTVADALVSLRAAAGAKTGEAPEGLTGPIASPAQLARMLAAAFEKVGADGGGAAGNAAGPDAPWTTRLQLPRDVEEALAHLTVYTRQPNVDAKGRPRVNLNTADDAELREVLGASFTDEQVGAVLASRRLRPFATIGELLIRRFVVTDAQGRAKVVRIDVGRFKPVADRLTVRPEAILAGLVNVNTAPEAVLRALPGLTGPDVTAIIAQRPGLGAAPDDADAFSSIAWLLDVISKETFAQLCPYVTTRSGQFRFQAVAEVGPDRRGERGFGGGPSALAVLERDAGRCHVLLWQTWRGPAEGD